MSLLQLSTSDSIVGWSTVSPSEEATTIMRLATCVFMGLLNLRSRQWLISAFTFVLYWSLQMQMMGILLILMVSIRSAMPPRSPFPDMPSTSSMISNFFCGAVHPPAMDTERLVTISLMALASFPSTPPSTSRSLFPRVSLAFTSVTMYPSAFAMIPALLVLPMPGGPLSSTAFLGPSLAAPARPFPFPSVALPRCVACQLSSHCCNWRILSLLPMRSRGCFGRCFVTHRLVSPTIAGSTAAAGLPFASAAALQGTVGAPDGNRLMVGFTSSCFTSGFWTLGLTSGLTSGVWTSSASGSELPEARMIAKRPSSSTSFTSLASLTSFALASLALASLALASLFATLALSYLLRPHCMPTSR
mmetsp:Transcript_17673/g.29690  ORF Transcript_17673/g.29690 Transcript_17673/m.29690 type:complete len:360 (-) Transcript_17673:973-2052(-)